MASPATTNIISREQYDEMFVSSGSESEDEDSDIDIISVSEESDSAVSESESEDSTETADEDEPLILDSSHFVSPTGIAVELPQDATDELDSFKFLFDDDIVDYIVAETKLYVQQKSSES